MLDTLAIFGFSIIIAVAFLIVVPYVRGRSDLLTSLNFFLIGVASFIGFSSIKAAYEPEVFRILEFTRDDYWCFILGGITFLVTLILTYRYFKLPRKLAGRTVRSWPKATGPALFGMVLFVLVLGVLSVRPPAVVGLAQICVQLGNKGIAIAVVLAFSAWCGNRTNVLFVVTLVGVLAITVVLAILGGGGRRTLVGVLVAIPITYYWLITRYRSPAWNFMILSVCAAGLFLLMAGYSSVRHFDRRGEKKERNLASVLQILAVLPSKMLSPSTITDTLGSIAGQNACQTGLTAIHLYTREEKPEPFHSLYFVAVSPIPRLFWEEKPKGLGYTLPKTARAKGTRATWGPSVIGHGYHEGGLHMVALYAALAGFSLRFFDELLVRQSNNPYLLAGFSASAGHIIGWTRGDIGTFTIQLIATMMTVLFISYVGRLVFGTGVTYPRTDNPFYTNKNLFRQPVAFFGS